MQHGAQRRLRLAPGGPLSKRLRHPLTLGEPPGLGKSCWTVALAEKSRERFLRRRGIGDLPSDDGTFEVTGAGVRGLLLERLHVDVAGTEADAVTRLDETHPDEAFSVETHVPFAAHVLDRDAAPGAEQSQVAGR
jgi:hypothetical protein